MQHLSFVRLGGFTALRYILANKKGVCLSLTIACLCFGIQPGVMDVSLHPVGLGLGNQEGSNVGAPITSVAKDINECPKETPDPNMQQALTHVDQSEYFIQYQPTVGTFQSPNRMNDMRLTYKPDGFEAKPRAHNGPQWNIAFQLKGIYRDGLCAIAADAHAKEYINENYLMYEQAGYRVEYLNNKDGMRQNFVVAEKPVGSAPLTVKMELEHNNLALACHNNELIGKQGGVTVYYYRDLKVWDANQRPLPAHMALDGDTLALVVDDRTAAYPITIDPLSTTPAATLECDQADARMGCSVASAGDVNGDGYDDVLVGACQYDNGQTDEGAVFVYYGSASGIGTTPSVALECNQADAKMGYSVASAGDVNNDGYDDVIVGAYQYDNGQTDEGAAFVYLGSAGGLSTTPAVTLERNQASANLGISVASAGDVNNDGYGDVIVGANLYDNGQTDEGAAFVYHGSAGGVSNTPAVTLECNEARASFGRSVASAGDVNNDGYGDVLVGANEYGFFNKGAAFVYHGSAGGVTTTAAATLQSSQDFAQTGFSVASAGDVNNDGYGDVIVGAYTYNWLSGDGIAYVYHGSASGIMTTAATTLSSGQAGAYMGYSVASAGDVNNDGYSDVVVGAYQYDNGQSNEGAALVYQGSASGINAVPLAILDGNQVDAVLGVSVASAGDVNGDGYSDLIVGASWYDNGQADEGAAFVYHGSGGCVPPTTANAGGDASVCGTSTNLAGNTPSVGTGTWTLVSGPGTANFGAAGSPTSSVMVSVTGAYTFRWTISNAPCTASTDDVTITFQQNPTAANAGGDASVCGTSTNLAGNAPSVGTGTWTLVSGPGTANFGAAGSPTSNVNVSVAGVYTFRWTISNAPCTASTDDVTITFQENPTVSNAGGDASVCGTSANLAGNMPSIGTGTWTLVSGPGTANFGAAGSPTSSVSVSVTGVYTFRWTISNAPCTASTDDVTITFQQNPTAANAGGDASVCGTSTNLAGNAPSVGTGTWTLVSGPGTANFGAAGSPTSSVSVSVTGIYTFRWTIPNAPCTASTDDVTITFQQNSTVSNAGGDASVCGTSTNLAGNTPSIGTGTWTLVSGPGTANFGAAGSPTSSVMVSVTGVYTFRWTISNAPCTASTDDVTITFQQNPTAANAGGDASVCGTSANLAGNTPSVGTGTWTLVSGPGTANFGAAGSPTSNVSVSVTGVYTFRWTISNAPCTASTDDVVVTFSPGPTTANAGGDASVCGTSANLAGNTPSIGTGTWTLVSGPGTANFGASGSPTSNVNVSVTGIYTFRWTISNAPCTASTDDVTITFQQNPTAANAGGDVSVCGTSTNLAGNAPSIGTGTWTLVSGPGTANFGAAGSPTSSVSVSVAGVYTFRWTISNAPCTASTDDVVVTFSPGPTAANAGGDASVCGTSANLAGNAPSIGTGTWTLVSGPGTANFGVAGSPTSNVNVSVTGVYTFRWTISNAPCTASTDDVTITFKQNPTAANAGGDASVCGTSANLAGNTPSIGTGTWTLVNGPGTANFGAAGSPTSSVSVSVAGVYTFRWTISNAPCTASTDDVVVTFSPGPTAANAGGDASVCGTSANLAGNAPSIGTGTWTLVSGPGTANFGAAGSPTSNVNVSVTGVYTFRWTISNAPCTASTDDVTITFQQNPTVSNAGGDASVCGTSANLAGNTPSIGTGTWTLVNGPGTANFGAAGSPTSNVNVSVAGVYTFRWTISNAPCTASTDDVVVTFSPGPTAANAGGDASVCGTSANLAGNAPSIGTGTWTLVSGPGTANFGAAGSPTSNVNVSVVGVYTFRWTISNAPCTASTDDVTITFQQNPTVSNAGGDASVCGTSANLAGNTPSIGTGTWTLVSGPGTANFGAAGSPTSSVSVSVAGVYTFRWTISNAPCTASTDDVVVTFSPGPTTANAGGDASVCGTSANLAGNAPSIGTGTWTLVSGPGTANFGAAGSPTSNVNVSVTGVYTFRWTISNAPCTASTDDVTITFQQNPTVSNAGGDASVCGTSTNLAGNAPSAGTGTWTLVSGPGTANFGAAGSPTSSVSVSVAGVYTFRWTISNAPCTASTDDVVVTFGPGPTAANAGGDASVCGTSANLAGNAPSIGTGTWTLVSGPGTANFGVAGSPTSNVNVSVTGVYTFRWTISNAPCTASTDDVTITFQQNPTVSNAGGDASVCGTSANLAGNTPSIGTGTWTLVNGPGTANFGAAGSPTSNVNVSVAGVYTFRWTISNAPCTASTDDVVVTFSPGPTAANAGGDASVCGTSANLAGNAPSIGTGIWTLVSGPGTANFGVAGSPTSNVNVSVTGVYTFRWTISNAPCTASTDDVTITFQQNPTAANAGGDVSVCGISTNLAGNAPSVGTGTWTLVSGPGTANFGAAGSPTSSVSVSVAGVYTFRWTISNAPCTASTDDVTITFQQNPTVSNVGSDQISTATCGLTQVTLAANAPSVGMGMWSVVSGMGGAFSDASSPNANFSGNAGGTYTLRWSVSNSPCPASTDDMVVTFNQNPTFSLCPPGVTVNTNAGCMTVANYSAIAAAVVPSSTVTYSLTGGTSGSGAGTGSGATFNLGTTLVVLTATNSCGTGNCSFNVVVQAPEINLQGNSMDIADGDNTPSNADHTDFGQTTGANVTRTFTIQNTGPVALPVTGIALGGTNANQFGVGALNPVSPIPAGQSATFTVTYAPNTTGIHNATVTIANGDCDESAYDFAIQGELTCSAPAFTTCPTATVELNTPSNGCAAIANYTVLANGLPTPALTYAFTGATTGNGNGTGSGLSFNKGITTVTVTATNPCGAPTCTFSVRVTDNVPPSITCPTPMTVSNTVGQCGATITYAPTVSDNCSGATFTVLSGPASGSLFPVGTTAMQLQATDAAGLTATCGFTVRVNDTEMPTITCPNNVVKSSDANVCGAFVTYANPTYSDNCSGAGLDHLSGGTSGSTFPLGTTNVVWMATDASNNTRTCSFSITVNDAQAPTITCPANMTRPTTTGQCAAQVTFNNPTASDNCAAPTLQWVSGGTGTVQGPTTSTGTFGKGTTTVQWKATDGAGLTQTCTFRVIVNDTEAPTMSCPAGLNVNASPGQCGAAVTYSTPTYTDNCAPTSGTAVRVSGPASGSMFSVGTTNVVFRATDAANNTRQCTLTVTVVDNQPPTISCPSSLTVAGSGSPCTATVFYTAPTASDNCAGTLTPFLVSGLASGSTYPVGTTVNTWRASDPGGVTAQCAFTVTVNCPTVQPPNGAEDRGEATSDLWLAPNPAATEVAITIQGEKEATGTLSVYDATGRLVWQQTSAVVATVRLDVSTWPGGVYAVSWRQGKTVMVKRLVVAR